MNGHNGQYVQIDQFEEHPNLLRIYNMLGGHSVIYLNDFYKDMCAKVAYHAGYVVKIIRLVDGDSSLVQCLC